MQTVLTACNSTPSPEFIGHWQGEAAVISSRENLAAFRQQTRYLNTFASSPLPAAAGMAVLNEIEGRGMREASAATGRVY